MGIPGVRGDTRGYSGGTRRLVPGYEDIIISENIIFGVRGYYIRGTRILYSGYEDIISGVRGYYIRGTRISYPRVYIYIRIRSKRVLYPVYILLLVLGYGGSRNEGWLGVVGGRRVGTRVLVVLANLIDVNPTRLGGLVTSLKF